MNSDSRIGPALMSRRIELGISLEQAARDTNIRARMLEVLESSDYAQYPPRGHAIGMLSSYARYLGLDSAAIVEVFDEEYEAFTVNSEIEKVARNARRGVGRFGERVADGKSRPVNRESSRARSQRKRRDSGSESTSKFRRNLQDEALAKDDERYRSGSVRIVGTRQTGSFRALRSTRAGVSPSPTAEPSTAGMQEGASASRRSSSTGSMRKTTTNADSFVARSTEDDSTDARSSAPNFFGIDVGSDEKTTTRKTRRRSSSREDAKRTEEVARPDDNIIDRIRRVLKSVFSERRTRLIAISALIIVIAVIIAASVLISTAGRANSGVIAVQGGAANETMTTDGENAAHKTITTANGNPVLIKVEVAKGETSLVEIMHDGANAYKGAAVGGQFSQEFSVAESFSATFSNPSAVSVTENGNPIEIALNEDGKTGSLFINIQTTQK